MAQGEIREQEGIDREDRALLATTSLKFFGSSIDEFGVVKFSSESGVSTQFYYVVGISSCLDVHQMKQ